MNNSNAEEPWLRIVFMGTPEFAVSSLDALLYAGFTISGVLTAPDKPSGRVMKLTESAVKKFGVEKKAAQIFSLLSIN